MEVLKNHAKQRDNHSAYQKPEEKIAPSKSSHAKKERDHLNLYKPTHHHPEQSHTQQNTQTLLKSMNKNRWALFFIATGISVGVVGSYLLIKYLNNKDKAGINSLLHKLKIN